ncbi:MAG: glycosyltransferase family 39 protein [Chromatiaceae bacterium]|nr:glycosyltransferase family 39 protein [Chromatiaceae bacterium]
MKAWSSQRSSAASGEGGIAAREPGNRERVALAVVVLLHLALVVPLAAVLNVWIDEAYTLRATGDGLAHAVRQALGFELQPPLYYVVLTLWRGLDDSPFFARLFSILCTASTVVVAGSLARRYLPGVAPALVAGVVAFNPLTVFAAVEARFYAPALLLSALLLLFFHDGYIAAEPSSTGRRRHAAAAVAALYTHYLLGFLLAAGGAALLALRRLAGLRRYVVAMILAAALFLPLAVTTVRQAETVGATGVSATLSMVGAAGLVWTTAWRQLLPVNQDSPLAVVRRWVSRLALPSVLLAGLASRRQPTAGVLMPMILAAVVSLFFVGVATRLGAEFVRPEHAVSLYLPILLAGLALLQYVGGARAATLGTLVSLTFSVPYLLATYNPPSQLGDWIRVAQYIEEHESVHEPILVYKAEFVLALRYHYAGPNRLIPLPRPTNEDRYSLTEQILQDQSEISGALSGHLGKARRFWLITSQTQPFRGIDFHPEILEEFVARRCSVLRDQAFVGSRVRLLEIQPQAEGLGTELQGLRDDQSKAVDAGRPQ